MSRQYFGCDVDLCVCRSDVGWAEYLLWRGTDEEVAHAVSLGGKLPYNLASLFPSIENPMEYWNNLDYNEFEPIEGSVEALQKISEYFGIVFISHVEGTHSKSKYYWLKKHFPFMESFMPTREKYVLNNSLVAMLDDQMKHLKGFDYNKRIRFNTPYTQDVECDVWKELDSWKDFNSELIRELLERK